MTSRPSDLVQSVSRASRIVDEVGTRPEGMTARQIATRCRLNLATTYHLLRTLRYEQFIRRGEGDRYVLGPKIANQFRDLMAAIERPPRVGEVLRYLTDTTGQSAYYGQIVGTQFIVTDVVEGPYSPHLEQLMVRLDEATHATALGKALLWALPSEERKDHLQERESRQHGLRPFTSNTVVDVAALSHELGRLGRQGVFIEQEQYRSNVCCSAVLVSGTEGTGAIAMPHSLERWRRGRTQLVNQLRCVGADLRRNGDVRRELPGQPRR